MWQGKLEIPTIHEGADARKIDEKFQNGQTSSTSWKVEENQIIKRRTVANEACDAGRVLINGRTAKASAAVKAGDVIEIQFGTKAVKVEVLDVQETVKKDNAAELYKYL